MVIRALETQGIFVQKLLFVLLGEGPELVADRGPMSSLFMVAAVSSLTTLGMGRFPFPISTARSGRIDFARRLIN